MANDMVTLRNKKTGQVIKVPKSQYVDTDSEKGISGIASDAVESISNLWPMLQELAPQLVTGAKQAGKNIVQHPVRSAANAVEGIGEGGIGLLNAPGNIAQYLNRKGIVSDDRANKMLHIPDLGIERKLGLDQGDQGDQFIKMMSSFLLPGGAAKLAGGGRIANAGAAATLAAGENQDPLQAAIMAHLIDRVTRPSLKRAASAMQNAGDIAPMNMQSIMQNAPDNLKATMDVIPEMAGKAIQGAPGKIQEMAGLTASSGLDAMAGLGSAAHIPVVPSLVEALSDYIKYKSVKPETIAQRKLFGDLSSSDIPKIKERMDAAKRLGLTYLTPAEATLSPFEAGKQGAIGRTSSGSKLLLEKGRQRSESEEDAINKLQKNIYDPEQLEPEKKLAYDISMSETVPDSFIDKWKDEPIVEHAISQLNSKPTYKSAIKNIPKNSFQYWNIVKRVIADMENEDAIGMKKFSSNEATKTRNAMVSDMDKIQPSYKQARKIAEREFTRKDIEKFFDKRNMTGNEFSKFLKSKKEFNNLLDKLEPYPEAQQNLKDMKLLFGDLIPNDPSIRSAAALEKNSMSSARNKVDAMKRILDEKYGKEHDIAKIKLMTNPNWPAIAADYLKRKGK